MSQLQIGDRIVMTLVDPPYTMIYLDATEEIRISVKASTPKFPVASGKSLIDNYQVEPEERSFSGIITSNKINDTYGSPLDAEAYVTAIRNAFNKGLKLNVNIPDGGSLNNCGITSFSATRNKRTATSFKVDITVKEIIYVDAVTTNTQTVVSPDKKDVLAKQENNDVTTKEIDVYTGDAIGNEVTITQENLVTVPSTFSIPTESSGSQTAIISYFDQNLNGRAYNYNFVAVPKNLKDNILITTGPIVNTTSTPTSN